MPAKLSQEEFIVKAIEVHAATYDLSKVVYVATHQKVIVGCKLHGEFSITPSNFLKGKGCRSCGIERIRLAVLKDINHFVAKARKIHGDVYDYSCSEYTKAIEKIKIGCTKHGVFEQKAIDHLSGRGCPTCAKDRTADSRRSSLEEFIEKATRLHGNKYRYDKVEYKTARTKVPIYCNECKKYFLQTPDAHINKGSNCPVCAKTELGESKALRFQEFVERAQEIHPIGRYEYYQNSFHSLFKNTKIKCSIHNKTFEMTAATHLKGSGCRSCAIEDGKTLQKLTTEDFVEKSKKLYGDLYDYSLTDYVNGRLPVLILCKIHGTFEINAGNFLAGHGCPLCATYGFNKGKPAHLYVLSVTGGAGTFTGYGISNKIEDRIVRHTKNLSESGFVIQQSQHYYFESGDSAAQIEKVLKGKYTTSSLSYEIEGFKTESTNTNFTEVVDFINSNGEDQWQSSTSSVPQQIEFV